MSKVEKAYYLLVSEWEKTESTELYKIILTLHRYLTDDLHIKIKFGR